MLRGDGRRFLGEVQDLGGHPARSLKGSFLMPGNQLELAGDGLDLLLLCLLDLVKLLLENRQSPKLVRSLR